ncbi:hypothetical protein V2J09_017462 [Rumex salicifolius]
MAAAKVATLLLCTVFLSALVFGGVRAQEEVHVGEETRSDGTDLNAVELEQLKLKIHRLEVRLEESDKIVKSKDEKIEKLKKAVQERSDSISKLQSEVVSIQKKGTSDVEDRVDKAYARAAELQNELDQVKNELETESEEKNVLKTQADDAEKKIQELNLKLKNFQKVTDEQKGKIHKLERALQVVEEEMVKAKLEASSKINDLLEVHNAWLPPWFVEHSFNFQTFIVTEWNEHGKPAMDVLTQKTVKAKKHVEIWASPHIETFKTTWVPAIQEQWILIVEYLEPHIKLVSTKTVETYEASKTAVKPHLIKAQELADPYYQDIKKFSKPYVEQVATMAKPHVEKARVALKPYTQNALDKYGKYLESATEYHHQVQVKIKEKMENHELFKQLATQELVWFVASAVLALPVIILFRMFTSMCW